jgi:hypothetical protein
VPGDDGRGDDQSVCIELSIGGMRVIRSSGLGPGTEVQVRVGLGQESQLDLAARVVWSTPTTEAFQLGLSFENEAAAESSLATLVADLRAQRSWGPRAL